MAVNDDPWFLEDDAWRKTTPHGGFWQRCWLKQFFEFHTKKGGSDVSGK